MKGYTTRVIHEFVSDTSSEDELPAKVKYSVLAQAEDFVPDDEDFFSEQNVK
jgi:hypothetical protein